VSYRSRLPLLALIAVALCAAATIKLGQPAFAQTAGQAPGVQSGVAGLWLVSHPEPDNPNAQDLILLDSDGTLLASETPIQGAPPPGAPSGVTQLFSSQGFGLWQATDPRTIAFKFVEVVYDQDGNYAGLTTIHGSMTVNGADSLSGTYTVTVTPAGGTSMDVITDAPLTATRITMNSTP
jgi:hypothetical protein